MDASSLLSFFGSHLSLTTLIGSLGALALVGLRKAQLPSDHPLKRLAQPALTVSLFPIGLIQLMTAVAYGWSLLRGDRVVDPFAVNLAFLLLGGVSGFNNFAQVGRKIPWAPLFGGGIGALTSAGLYYVAAPLNPGTVPVVGACVAIALLLWYSMTLVLLPVQETVKALGDVSAFSPVMIGLQVPAAVLAILAAMQVVVL